MTARQLTCSLLAPSWWLFWQKSGKSWACIVFGISEWCFLENPPHGMTFVSSTSVSDITTSMKTTWHVNEKLFFVYMKAEVKLQLKANFQKICKWKCKWQLLFIHYSFAKPVFYCNLLPCLIIDATFPPQPSVKMLLQYRLFFFFFFFRFPAYSGISIYTYQGSYKGCTIHRLTLILCCLLSK